MKTKGSFCLFLLIFVFANCSQKNNKIGYSRKIIDTCNCVISSIDALYYNYIFDTSTAVNWNDVKLNVPDFKKNSHGVLDAKITNCLVLREINEELKTIHPMTKQWPGADVRIVFSVNYKNGKDTVFTICGYFSDMIFSKERVALSTNNTNRLLFLLKNNIGYYSWIDKDYYQYMPEIQDSSFRKESIIESLYYKKYKKIQVEGL